MVIRDGSVSSSIVMRDLSLFCVKYDGALFIWVLVYAISSHLSWALSHQEWYNVNFEDGFGFQEHEYNMNRSFLQIEKNSINSTS